MARKSQKWLVELPDGVQADVITTVELRKLIAQYIKEKRTLAVAIDGKVTTFTTKVE